MQFKKSGGGKVMYISFSLKITITYCVVENKLWFILLYMTFRMKSNAKRNNSKASFHISMSNKMNWLHISWHCVVLKVHICLRYNARRGPVFSNRRRLTIHIQIGLSSWVIFNIYLQLCKLIAALINWGNIYVVQRTFHITEHWS